MNTTNTLSIEQYLEDIAEYTQQVNDVILLAMQNNVLSVVEKY
jgi:hypothetical protein